MVKWYWKHSKNLLRLTQGIELETSVKHKLQYLQDKVFYPMFYRENIIQVD